MKIIFLQLLVLFSLVGSICQNVNQTDNSGNITLNSTKSEAETVSASDNKNVSGSSNEQIVMDKSIRKIDFNNFEYRWCAKNNYIKNQSLRLENGEQEFFKDKKRQQLANAGFDLWKIIYADLTNDGKEDAIVTISGSEYPGQRYGCIYIFNFQKNEVKEIWNYYFGEKWHDGLRKLSVDDSRLTLELYTFVSNQKDEIYFDKEHKGEINRANFYNKLKFKWEKIKFDKVSEELISNPTFSHDFTGFYQNEVKLTEAR